MGNIVRNTTFAFLMFYQINTLAEVNTTGSAVDKNGNIIVIGYCLGNVAIGGQQFNITTPSSFITKLDSDGEVIWIKIISSSQSLKANAIATDNFGNIYIVGGFSGTANFDSNLLTAQAKDFFIAKYYPSGNLFWVKKGYGSGDDSGRDIYFSHNGMIYICGDTESLIYDNLNATQGGFVLKTDLDGNGLLLFNSFDKTYKITNDSVNQIIVGGAKYVAEPINNFTERLTKYSPNGILIWSKSQSPLDMVNYPVTDQALNVIAANSGSVPETAQIFKYNASGEIISSVPFTYSSMRGFKKTTDDHFIVIGAYFQNAQMGDSILSSNGQEDGFITKLDTSFNVIWIKHGGGLYQDELNSISTLNDGSMIASSNLRGTINFDSVHIAGGNGSDDQWTCILKFSNDGNIIWIKKIGENTHVTSSNNWFPLEVGNKLHYFCNVRSYPPPSITISLRELLVTDSITANNLIYYRVNNFFEFPDGTLIRFDLQSQRLLLLHLGVEYTFVDFSKSTGETYFQIQPDGSFSKVSATSGYSVVIGDTLTNKGFYNSGIRKYGYYNFVKDIGLVNQNEEWIWWHIPAIDFFTIEYLFYGANPIHKKHTNVPVINLEPILFLPSSDRIIQNFQITHAYSAKSNPQTIFTGMSYMKSVYLQSFYSNNSDTIWNNNYNVSAISEIDYSLNYQFDTTKYEQGYHLYYRIAAVDKGIIADTFYSPPTGYYKLYWRDSTTSVTQINPEVFDYSLSQNYPNPFNPSAKISFSIPEREFVSLKVFDILGSEITTLVNEEMDAGKYEVDFDGSKLSSGIYIYRIVSGSYTNSKKMILVK